MKKISLSRYLIEQHHNGNIKYDLRLLIEVVARSCKIIAHHISKGDIDGFLGVIDKNSVNIQGEVQKKLDVLANEILLEANEWGGHLAAIASEEIETVSQISGEMRKGDYLLLFDPLDGSSNVDNNLTVGTIFSVLPLCEKANKDNITEEDFLQKGVNQVAAGFAIYGPQTMFILTLKNGVVGFTLDKEMQTFILTHPKFTIPETTAEFAINVSNMRKWEKPVQNWVNSMLQGIDGELGKDYNMRWLASMVGEVQRILVRGGVFAYPSDKREDKRNGHLRLMYEANPMALIVEQAGGKATNGFEDILQIQPTSLHQRVPIFLGSKEEIERVNYLHSKEFI